tara:strand:- start:20914 stop:21132 length:219 start_codon:yes stop_codon:yes gene_type:complete
MHKATFDYKGEFLTLSEIAAKTGQPENRLRMRVSRGWSLREAASTKKMTPSESGRKGRKGSQWSRTFMEGEK